MNLLQAEPEPLEIDVQRTAIVVIDMQNAFVSKGGMLDLRGFDILPIQKTIEPIKRIISAARAKGRKVVYITHRYSPNLHDSGSPNSPNWYKEGSLRDYREHPEWRDKLIIRGTWGAEIIGELKPQEDDILIEKPRYSAFFGTNLDMILRAYDIKYLAFVGVTTNICVETSIRDAYNLDYFTILISDATASVPASMHETTIHNVVRCFGWVTTTENLVRVMQ